MILAAQINLSIWAAFHFDDITKLEKDEAVKDPTGWSGTRMTDNEKLTDLRRDGHGGLFNFNVFPSFKLCQSNLRLLRGPIVLPMIVLAI